MHLHAGRSEGAQHRMIVLTGIEDSDRMHLRPCCALRFCERAYDALEPTEGSGRENVYDGTARQEGRDSAAGRGCETGCEHQAAGTGTGSSSAFRSCFPFGSFGIDARGTISLGCM